ncbi:prepilin-type N-terminal cleavage/methylation domain-containing protein [Planococcus maitriensis]|uniref:Tfp assembly type protein n=1 Tax=Planococcus maitriensis TaxID=221799 RepID=A0A365K7Q8_9BACL|nr:prepilin-type N-terminal cleavage/methylation domain-containing protein [Planococcus maitriensis]RAZ68577.1 Tfp assembly type protein [Planococcus maitriensis]
MKKFLQKKLKDQKGMTLIELLAVIVIIAIIAAIAIPAIGNIIENSRYSAVKSDATNVLSAANIYFTENSDDDKVTVEKLIDDGFLESEGELGEDTFVDNVNPIKITSPTAVIYSGDKTVTFTNATLKEINDDTKKGSDDNESGFTIGTATSSGDGT